MNPEVRDDLARILETVAKDGLPGPRDLDVAIDAIESLLKCPVHDVLQGSGLEFRYVAHVVTGLSHTGSIQQVMDAGSVDDPVCPERSLFDDEMHNLCTVCKEPTRYGERHRKCGAPTPGMISRSQIEQSGDISEALIESAVERVKNSVGYVHYSDHPSTCPCPACSPTHRRHEVILEKDQCVMEEAFVKVERDEP